MRTAKAYAAAILTVIAAALTAATPFTDADAAPWLYAALAALTALGVVWRVPNAAPGHAAPAGRVLDAIPAVVGLDWLTPHQGGDAAAK